MNIGRASFSSDSFYHQWTYDVFLNFRGETRHGFTGSLYNALCQSGIHAFMDDEEINKGEQIKPTLLQAIQESRMAIIIFSNDYASSTFCLDELVKILQCIKGIGRLVLPIFYNVDPSDVRYQKGKYEEALAMHKKNLKDDDEKVQIWKSALHEAANMSGLHFDSGHEYEYTFIEKIVKEISTKINRSTDLHIAEYPVGLEMRVQEMNFLLGDYASNDTTNIVGICGIGGIGKTTIARAVYNSIANHFEGLCFLHDLNGYSSELGLQKMQERMLLDILGIDIMVENVNKGISIIKRRLNRKKILLVLDNVNEAKQLEKLAGNCSWFGLGSRIIITTRNKQLLARHGIEKIYEVKEFNAEESLELLRWNVFKNNQVDSSFREVLNCAVHYAKGLPLALEVLGSLLFGKTINECKSALDMYRKIPNKNIQQILKLSYDSLEEAVQELFLDIACFFQGKLLEYAKDILGHVQDGYDPCYGIRVLENNCLIKIESSCIRMHDLIQDMGREIVRQESPNEPGERSRVWFYEDIIHVLENNTGTNKIRAMILNNPLEGMKVNWDGKAFKKMKSLKICVFERARFSKGPKYLPNSLRVLQWPEYPTFCLPVDFHPTRLGILDLQHSCLRSLPIMRFDNLSVLNLHRCPSITQISGGFPNLRELKLDYCENLIEVHPSVGYIGKLEILSMERCVKLRTFPSEMKLPSLKHLGLRGCSSLEKFPEILEKMDYIRRLDLSETNLELPHSIHNLTNLEILRMHHCGRILLARSITLIPKLLSIDVERCGELGVSKQNEGQEGVSSIQCLSEGDVFLTSCSLLSDEMLRIYLPYFAKMETLRLSHSSFTILPVCIKEFHFLKYLHLDHCSRLREIRGIPPNIKELRAANCISLSRKSRRTLLCQELLESSEFETLRMPGERVPGWFDHCNRGSYVSFWFRGKLPLISVCHVIPPEKEPRYLAVHVKINGRGLRWRRFPVVESTRAPHLYVIGQSLMDFESQVFRESGWNHVELYSYYNRRDLSEWETKEMGIYVDRKASSMEDITYTNPYKRPKSNDIGSEWLDNDMNKASFAVLSGPTIHRGVEQGPPITSMNEKEAKLKRKRKWKELHAEPEIETRIRVVEATMKARQRQKKEANMEDEYSSSHRR